jgi:tripartite-type tricarboxylate transporter receptor subunit TctC
MSTGKLRIGRRQALIGIGAAAFAKPSVANTSWPTRPVKVVVPYAPGGASDTMARPWVDKLQQALGQPFVIENRGGASGTIGTESVARSTPDGYTFLFAPNSTLNVVPQLRKVSYDARKDLKPVGRVGDLHTGFVIVASLGLNTLTEVIAHAKKNPGKLAYGSAGLATSTHLRIEMLKLRAGVDILHVPYRGSADALNDLLAGQVQMMNEIIVLPHVRAGKLRLLSINHEKRNQDFPDVPTLTELGYPNSDVPVWYSIQAPAGTPPEIITKFNQTIVEIAKTDDMIRRLREISVIVPLQTPEQITAFYEADLEANGKLIREANIKLDS